MGKVTGLGMMGGSVTDLVAEFKIKNKEYGIILFVKYEKGNESSVDFTVGYDGSPLDPDVIYYETLADAEGELTNSTYFSESSGNFRIPLDMCQDETIANITFSFTGTAITAMSRAADCIVTYATHGLETGDFVSIEDIESAEWLDLNGKVYEIEKHDANSFHIGVDTSGFAAGYVDTDPGTISTGKITAFIRNK